MLLSSRRHRAPRPRRASSLSLASVTPAGWLAARTGAKKADIGPPKAQERPIGVRDAGSVSPASLAPPRATQGRFLARMPRAGPGDRPGRRVGRRQAFPPSLRAPPHPAAPRGARRKQTVRYPSLPEPFQRRFRVLVALLGGL